MNMKNVEAMRGITSDNGCSDGSMTELRRWIGHFKWGSHYQVITVAIDLLFVQYGGRVNPIATGQVLMICNQRMEIRLRRHTQNENEEQKGGKRFSYVILCMQCGNKEGKDSRSIISGGGVPIE
jgi:hypothetical protein